MNVSTRIGARELAASLAERLSLPEEGVAVLLEEIGEAVVGPLREGHAVELGDALTLSLADGIEIAGEFAAADPREEEGIEVGSAAPAPVATMPAADRGAVLYFSRRTGPFRDRIHAHCAERGIEVLQPIAAAEALRWIGHNEPAAFVFESGAPGWRELARELKCNPGTNHVPVIGMFAEDELDRPLTQLTVRPDIALFMDPCPFERFLEAAEGALEGGGTDGDAFDLSGAQGDRREACILIEEVLYRAGLPEFFCREARRALAEALDNAVRHGHRRDERRTVSLRMLLDEERLVLAVRDAGPGFAYDRILPTARAAAALPSRPGTREPGLVAMLRVADAVDFNRRGNEVVLTRLRPRR